MTIKATLQARSKIRTIWEAYEECKILLDSDQRRCLRYAEIAIKKGKGLGSAQAEIINLLYAEAIKQEGANGKS